MSRQRILIFLIMASAFASAFALNVDSMLRVLDKTIERRDYYYMIRETRIDSLKNILAIPGLQEPARREVLGRLFDEYSKYQGDSARKYAEILRELPAADADSRIRGNIAMIFIYTSGGLFNQALDIIEQTDLTRASDDAKGDYYFVLVRTYSDISNYVSPAFNDEYARLSHQYADSVMKYKAPGSYEAHYSKVFRTGQTLSQEEKIREFSQLLRRPDLDISGQAMIASMLGDLYRDKPDRQAMIYYKALSANLDILSAKHETTASRDLALYLYEDGDVERASRLINLAHADAKFYNGRHRMAEIANILPLIEQKRYSDVSSQRNTLIWIVMGFLILVIALVWAILYIIKQLKLTHRQRNEIEVKNRQIEEASAAIEKQNMELKHTNLLLQETNQIKNEYIGLGFSISASYMDKIEKLYNFVDSKLADKQYELLRRSLKKRDLREDKEAVLKEFDQMFLTLFPSFIRRYNALFPAEEHSGPAEDEPANQSLAGKVGKQERESLTSEMRIFALIRLGITDSSKIATLLNYSVNTVNAYKTKAKNRSLVPNEKFESKIMEIRSVSPEETGANANNNDNSL